MYIFINFFFFQSNNKKLKSKLIDKKKDYDYSSEWNCIWKIKMDIDDSY